MEEMFKGEEPTERSKRQIRIVNRNISNIKEELKEIEQKNPETHAYFEYDKLCRYSEELREEGLVWTESRKELIRKAVNNAMGSCPLAVFFGESGTGKTALAKATAQRLTGKDYEREVGGKETRFKEILARQEIGEDGSSYYKYGPLLRAMTGDEDNRINKNNKGGIYFDDEFNTRSASTQRQVLKFVSNVRIGKEITVPGFVFKVKVAPGFLYLAAGNPPSARYERYETPIEAYREFGGNVLNVDYLEQTPDNPELYHLILAGLINSNTKRIDAVSKKEIESPKIEDKVKNRRSLDTRPEAIKKGGFIWRFANAWKELFNSFSHQDNILSKEGDFQPEDSYINNFILDPGVVIEWLYRYKQDLGDQTKGLEKYIIDQLNKLLKSHLFEDDQELVRKILKKFGIDLEKPKIVNQKNFKVLTPRALGALMPNVEEVIDKKLEIREKDYHDRKGEVYTVDIELPEGLEAYKREDNVCFKKDLGQYKQKREVLEKELEKMKVEEDKYFKNKYFKKKKTKKETHKQKKLFQEIEAKKQEITKLPKPKKYTLLGEDKKTKEILVAVMGEEGEIGAGLILEHKYMKKEEFLRDYQKYEDVSSSPEVEKVLVDIAGDRYLSIDRMNEVLQNLPGVDVSIPEEEIRRLKSLVPKELSPEMIDRLKKLKKHTEDESAPLIQQIPAKIIVDGEEKDFTINTLKKIWDKARESDDEMKGMYLDTDYIKEETLNKVWDGELRAYTSRCLKGSKNKEYKDQLAHQKTLLGDDAEVYADMYIVFCMRYLSSHKKEQLFTEGWARLNELGNDAAPLRVSTSAGYLYLVSSNHSADVYFGLGASLGISSSS